MVSFENFVKSMPPSLSELKVIPSFCFTFKKTGWKYKLIESLLDAARSSGILKAKQKLGRTFDSDKLGGIAFTKISKLTMCSA